MWVYYGILYSIILLDPILYIYIYIYHFPLDPILRSGKRTRSIKKLVGVDPRSRSRIHGWLENHKFHCPVVRSPGHVRVQLRCGEAVTEVRCQGGWTAGQICRANLALEKYGKSWLVEEPAERPEIFQWSSLIKWCVSTSQGRSGKIWEESVFCCCF